MKVSLKLSFWGGVGGSLIAFIAPQAHFAVLSVHERLLLELAQTAG